MFNYSEYKRKKNKDEAENSPSFSYTDYEFAKNNMADSLNERVSAISDSRSLNRLGSDLYNYAEQYRRMLGDEQYKRLYNSVTDSINGLDSRQAALNRLKQNPDYDNIVREQTYRDRYEQRMNTLNRLGNDYNSLVNGNVDYNKRPHISSGTMKSAGWDVGEGKDITTYTQGYTIGEGNNKYTVDISPIMDNGKVLTPDELKRYVNSLNTSGSVEDLLKSDTNKIIVNAQKGDYDSNYWLPLEDKLSKIKDDYANVYNEGADDKGYQAWIDENKYGRMSVEDIDKRIEELKEEKKSTGSRIGNYVAKVIGNLHYDNNGNLVRDNNETAEANVNRQDEIENELARLNNEKRNRQYDTNKKEIEALSDDDRSALATIREYEDAKTYTQDNDFIASTARNAESARAKLTEKGYSNEQIDDLVSKYITVSTRQESEQWKEDVARDTEEHPLAMTAASFMLNGLTNIPIALGTVLPDAIATATGNEDRINPYDQFHMLADTKGTIREKGQEWAEGLTDINIKFIDTNLGKTLYNALTSGVDSAINVATASLVGGVAGIDTATEAGKEAVAKITSAIMGSEVASSQLTESLRNGESATRALTKSITAGVIEGITEKYSVEAILGGLDKGIIRSLAKSFIAEGSEELASDVLNDVVDEIDYAITGHQGEIRAKVADYMAQGMSEAEATNQALIDTLQGYGESALTGAISGLVMGGSAYGNNVVDRGLTGVSNAVSDRVNANALANNDVLRSLAESKASAELGEYERLVENADDSRKSKRAIKKAAKNVVKQTRKNISAEDRAIMDTKVAESIKADTESEYTEQDRMKAYKLWADGKTIAPYYQKVLSSMNGFEDAVKSANTAINEQAEERTFKAIENATRKKSAADTSGFNKGGNGITVEYNGENATIKNIDGNSVVLSNGDTVDYADVKMSDSMATVVVQTEELAKAYKLNSAQTESIISDAETIIEANPDANADYVMFAIEDAMKYGSTGFENGFKNGTFTSLFSDNEISQKVLERVYNEANSKRESVTQRKNKGKGTTSYIGEAEKSLKKDNTRKVQADYVSKVVNEMGVNLVFGESKNIDGKFVMIDENGNEHTENGNYDPKTNTIYIDINSGNLGTGLIIFTAAHELTHAIRANNSKGFNTFADYLLSHYSEGKLNALMRAKANALGLDMQKDYDTIYEEVVADSCERFLLDGNLAERLTELKNTDTSLFNKIKNYIQKLIDAFKALKNDIGVQNLINEHKEADIVAKFEDYDKLINLWEDALIGASQAETKSTETKAEIKNSTRDTEYLKAVESGDTDKAQKLVEKAAMDWGAYSADGKSPLELFHGTRSFGFTEFDLDKMDDKTSIFLTSDIGTAGTYSGTDEKKRIVEANKKTPETLEEIAEYLRSESSVYKDVEIVPNAKVKKAVLALEPTLNNLKKALASLQLPEGNETLVAEKTDIDNAIKMLKDKVPYRINLEYTLRDIVRRLGTARRSERFANLVNKIDDSIELVKCFDDNAFKVTYSEGWTDYLSENFVKSQIESRVGIGNYALYAKLNNPLVVDAKGNVWNRIPSMKKTGSSVDYEFTAENGNWFLSEFADTRRFAKYAKEHKYDGVVFTNIVDDGGRKGYYYTNPADYIIVSFNPSDVKSADTVTYDDNGNVIPLSERFSESKDIRYSERDSTGKPLSKEQVGFFKDSKVRDENGNLLVVYHGTDNEFFTFDMSKSDEHGGSYGYGFYFTPEKTKAKAYGNRIIEAYLNIKKPAYFDKKTISLKETEKLVSAIVDFELAQNEDEEMVWQDSFMSNYVYTYGTNKKGAISETAKIIFGDGGTSDADIVLEIATASGLNYDLESIQDYYNVLEKEIGIDGLWKDNEIIAFSSNQAKLTDNLNPTENEDIRYSEREALNELNTISQKMMLDGQLGFGDIEIETEAKHPLVQTIYDILAERDRLDKFPSSWANGLKELVKNNPEYDYVVRLANKDQSARKELQEIANGTDDVRVLRYIPILLSHFRWGDSYRGANRIVKNIFDKRLHEVEAEHIGGRDIGFQNKNYTVDEIHDIFNSLNQDEDLRKLADKVFGVIEDFGNVTIQGVSAIKDKYGRYLSNASGVHSGNIIHYRTSYMNDKTVTDQEKATTLLHEAIHEVTTYAIIRYENGLPLGSQRLYDAVNIIEDVYKQLRRKYTSDDYYGMTDAMEMMAELSNPKFRAMLKKESVWDRIVDAIRKIFGIEKSDALGSLSVTLDRLLDDYANNRERLSVGTRLAAVSYSMRDQTFGEVNAALRKENEKLKKLVKLQRTLTHGKLFTRSSVEAQASKFMKEYGINRGKGEIADMLNNLYEFIASNEELNWEDVMTRADRIAKEIVERSEKYGITDEGQEVLDYLKGAKIKLTDTQKQEIISQYGSLKAFKDKFMGRIVFNDNGVDFDSWWKEASEVMPHIFDENINEGDMPSALTDILESAKEPQLLTSADGMQRVIADEIYDSYWDVSTLHTFADNKQKEINQLKAKHNEQMAEIRAKRDEKIKEIRQKNMESRHNASERRQKTVVRNKIKKLISTYESMLTNPNKNKRVPARLVNSVIDALKVINIDSGRAKTSYRAELLSKLEAVERMYKSYESNGVMSQYFDEVIYERIKAEIDNLKENLPNDVSLYNKELSLEQLQSVYESLKSIGKAIRDGDEVRLGNERIAREEFQRDATAETKSIPNKMINPIKRFIFKQLSAERMFNTFGNYAHDSAWNKLYRILNNGQLKATQLRMEATKYFQDLLDGENLKKMERMQSTKKEDLVDIGFVDENGNNVLTTRAMMLSIAMHLRNEDNMRHLLIGGLTVPDLARYYSGKSEIWGTGSVRANVIDKRIYDLLEERQKLNEMGGYEEEVKRLTEEIDSMVEDGMARLDQIAKTINDGLTDYEKEWLEKAQKFFDEWSKNNINATTMEMYDFAKAIVDNYFPIHTDPKYREAMLESIKKDLTLENAGWLKERVHASNPVLLEDLTDVINTQINQVSRFCGLAPAIKEFNKVYGGKSMNDSMNVRKALNDKFGSQADKYIEDLLADLQGARGSNEFVDRLFGKLRGAMAQATLTMNLRVALAQAASYPTASVVVGHKALAKALVKGGKDGKMFSKADKRMIEKYSPLLWYRLQGNMDIDIANIKDQKFLTKANRKLSFLTNWIQQMDGMTVGRLWYAAEYYVQDELGISKDNEEKFYTKVAEVFNDIVEKTQPNYTTMQRPEILRTKSPALKMLTMFMTQRLQNFNILYDATSQLVADVRGHKQGKVSDEQLRKSKKKMASAVSSQMVATMTITVMKGLVDALLHNLKRYKDDDDEVTAESAIKTLSLDYLNSVVSNVVLGSELYDIIYKIITGERYYGISLQGVSTLTEMCDYVVKLGQDITGGKDASTISKDAVNITKMLCQGLGIPLNNALKIKDGIVKWATDIKNAIGSGELVIDSNEKSVARATRMHDNGNTKAGDEMLKELYDEKYEYYLDKGYTETEAKKKAEESIRGSIYDAYRDEYKEAYLNGDKATMSQIKTSLSKYGYGVNPKYSEWEKSADEAKEREERAKNR